MIKCIDFDEKFGKYAEGWIAANRSKYKNMDLLEEQIPEVYLRWLNTPADWLDGKTPGEWFNQFEDANELVELMRAYQKAKINMPDPLLERVTDLGEDAVAPLMQLVKEYDIVIEQFRAGVMAKLGLSYEDLKEVNPSIA